MMQRALGDDGFRRLPGRARRARDLHAHARAGRRHPADDARPVGQSRAGKARPTSTSKLLEEIAEYQRHSLRRQEHPGHHPRRLPGAEAQARRRAAHRDQRRGDRRDRPGRPDRRRDDGRLDQPQRLHQAHAGQRLPGPAPRRQGHQGGQDRRGRSDRAPVRRQHARLPAVLHQPGQGLLAKGLRPAAAEPREPRPGGRQPAEPGRGREDRRLPRRPRFRRSPIIT